MNVNQKTAMAVAILAALSFFAATASASTITTTPVDFSVLMVDGVDTAIDITVEHGSTGLTLNGVNFLYDNQQMYADPPSPDFGQAQSFGIWGTTNGVLALTFDTPVVGLHLDFSVFGDGVTGPDPYALVAIFPNDPGGDAVVIEPGMFTPYDPSAPAVGQIDGKLNYQNHDLPFTQAYLYFSPVSPDSAAPVYFSVSNVSYDTVTVPEPSTFVLLAFGLCALWGWKFHGRKS